MIHALDFIRELNFLSVLLRMLLALACGGCIGIEREYKRRPAGFRTHILISVGAAMTTLTSQYLYLSLHMYTDIARLGAQVIAGVGFIGAGTIIVTKQKHVKGLTTAAGLWTAAIIGLACGAGYVECAVFATVMVIFAELVLIKLEKKISSQNKAINIYIEYAESKCIERIIKTVRNQHLQVSDLQITRVNNEDGHKYCTLIDVQGGNGHTDFDDLLRQMHAIDGVLYVEEM